METLLPLIGKPCDVDQYEFEIDTVPTFDSPAYISGSNAYLGYSNTDVDTRYDLTNVIYQKTYYWRVRAVTSGASSSWSNTWSFKVQDNTGINLSQKDRIGLKIYPSPMQKAGNIEMNVSEQDRYSITVFDITGKKVDVILNDRMLNPGKYTLTYENKNLTPGTYFIKLFNSTTNVLEKFVVVE